MCSKIYVSYIMVGFLFLLAGCTKLILKTEQKPEESLINQRINQIQKYNGEIGYFHGKALVIFRRKIDEEVKTYSFRAEVFSNIENNVRINISDFLLNKPLISISIVSKKVTIVDHVKQKLIEENIDRVNTSNFFNLNIPLEFFIQSIIGKIYIIDSPDRKIEREFRESKEIIKIYDKETTETLYYNSDLLPIMVVLSEKGEEITLNFKKRDNENRGIPKKITFLTDGNGLEVNYSEISIDKSISDSIFSLNDIDFSRFKKENKVE